MESPPRLRDELSSVLLEREDGFVEALQMQVQDFPKTVTPFKDFLPPSVHAFPRRISFSSIHCMEVEHVYLLLLVVVPPLFLDLSLERCCCEDVRLRLLSLGILRLSNIPHVSSLPQYSDKFSGWISLRNVLVSAVERARGTSPLRGLGRSGKQVHAHTDTRR